MYAHLVGVRVLLDELEGVELGVGSALSVSVGVADGDEADEGDCRGSKGRLRAVTGADMMVAVREQDALSRSRSRVSFYCVRSSTFNVRLNGIRV